MFVNEVIRNSDCEKAEIYIKIENPSPALKLSYALEGKPFIGTVDGDNSIAYCVAHWEKLYENAFVHISKYLNRNVLAIYESDKSCKILI